MKNIGIKSRNHVELKKLRIIEEIAAIDRKRNSHILLDFSTF